MNTESAFKKFWVKSVNNYLCDADYNGNALKERSPIPSFRKYYFIKSWEDLNGFTQRDGITNRELVEKWLAESKEPLYRQLNKERSQGVFSVEDTPMGTGKGLEKQLVTEKALIASFKYHDWNMSKQVRRYTKENIATAKYTALAVNNLSSLAEALVNLIIGYEKRHGLLDNEGLHPEYFAAKEALLKIS